MRLKSIKLAGFKSFVDPTTFDLPGQLIGVVGPNGCGKSNIIDAVRWVLGESRASELRGESMQDVIFNGSGLRKPSGRASVELVFDNTEGRAQGQWSVFAEISVKRVLTRDGASNYLINQQSVRRKDIQDMFLGTGLGPKAYAIIGQGTISRIIESKPEELRIFLEEAAGVSKYKERRKETEARLEDTQENLTRVRDILRELDAQLVKLESQALVANQYQEYQQQMLEKQHLLWVLRLIDGEKSQRTQIELMQKFQLELDQSLANLRATESNLESKRTQQYDLQNSVSQAQGDLYEVNANITRIESEIRFTNESKLRIETQLENLNLQIGNWQNQFDSAQNQLEQLALDLTLAKTKDDAIQLEARDHEASLPDLDRQWNTSKQKVSQARQELLDAEKKQINQQAQTQNFRNQLEQSEQRLARLNIDFEQLKKPDEQALITALDRSQNALKKRDEAQQKAQVSQQAVPLADKARQESQNQLQLANQSLNQTKAKLSALVNIQEKVQAQGKLRPWLEKFGLQQAPRLWQKIQVENGWESALESILRERVGALQSTHLEEALKYVEQSPPSRVAWFEANSTQDVVKNASVGQLTPFLSRVLVKDPSLNLAITEWLANVFVIDSVSEGFAKRMDLPIGGVFVAKSGHIVSRVGIQLYAQDNEQAGLIARAKEIESLELQTKSELLILEQATGEHALTQVNYQAAHQQVLADRQTYEQSVKDAHRFEMEALQLRQAEQEYATRAGQIQKNILEVKQQLSDLTQAIQSNQLESQASQTSVTLLKEQLDTYSSEFENLQIQRDEALRQNQRYASSAQESSYRVRTLIQKQEDLQTEMDRSEQQIEQMTQSASSLQVDLQNLSDASLQIALQAALNARFEKETELAKVRTQFDELMFEIKSYDEKRMGIEKDIMPLREKITSAQLKEQAAQLSVAQFTQLLVEADAKVDEIKETITPQHQVSSLQSAVQSLAQSIQSLGPVNMAALEELKIASERKGFLDAQSADLNEAISTLTDAIMRIDAETRTLLQDTFDQVNHHFSQIFPALFGGGNARLEMTGSEILDSGVQVMAQPPGKKNSTIHLLSGGEKALTAISLVFSLFQLNPAPFCLLDEVDAPLDDANTSRYADIVAKMSQKTQFLFISHNKITMEIANQLIGVTMQEQGVSRVVAVDLQAATALTLSI